MRKVLIIAIVVLSLILASMLGFIWYQNSHIFVEGEAYAKNAKQLDLRGEEISFDHYLTVQAQLPECRILWDVPFQDRRYSSDTPELAVVDLTAEDIQTLQLYFTDLKRVDATACRNYTLLAQLVEKLPGCEVVYHVDLGGETVLPSQKELTLEPGQYTVEALTENLQYLPALQQIHFRNAEMTAEQMDVLAQTYPDIEMRYTVEIFGKEYDLQTTTLDLSSLAPGDVAEVASRLGVLTALETVELMPASGVSNLSLEDVKLLVDAAPNAVFHYEFQFYGYTISTTDAEVHMKKVKPDENILKELRKVLGIMETCERFVIEMGQYDMIKKNVTSAELSEIREEFRDRTKLVWRVYFGDNGSSLTDAEIIRAVYGLTDDNSKNLIYCEDVRYIDFGHNEFLDEPDFLAGMKNLEVAILSGAPLKSLDAIANCKNLKFLEIANCIYLPDIEALRQCTQLEMLNISFTRFTDISPLEDLKLTHLTSVMNQVSDEDIEAFIENNPDCWTVYEGDQPYGEGWRYDADDKPLAWYQKMIDAFRYPNPYNNVGWYLEK